MGQRPWDLTNRPNPYLPFPPVLNLSKGGGRTGTTHSSNLTPETRMPKEGKSEQSSLRGHCHHGSALTGTDQLTICPLARLLTCTARTSPLPSPSLWPSQQTPAPGPTPFPHHTCPLTSLLPRHVQLSSLTLIPSYTGLLGPLLPELSHCSSDP